MKNLIKAILFFLVLTPLKAQETSAPVEKRKYTTKAISGPTTPVIDGLLNDAVWDQVEWTGDFIQRRPDEGKAPSQNTQFKVLYDDRYIYAAFRCFDTEPDKIVKRLSRRDGFEGDWVYISLDSYHDLQSCYSFNISVSGVKGDEVLTSNGNSSDDTWNPIWYSGTNIDEQGWTAEMKIPLSQLRFGNAPEQIWGMQVERKIFREEERVGWQQIPADAGGWVSEFGELHGIKNIKPKRQVEIQPYTLGKAASYEKQAGNPFRTGSDYQLTGGLDGKIGLTNAITMDFTINPDFGQVEADPAAIALDGFQIFFQERRPFFVENRNIFDYQVSNSEAGNTFGFDNLFYSRRIGKNPSYYPQTGDNDFVDQPTNTSILGAAKISGQTKNGWSLGIMESVTGRAFANIDNQGEQREELVEPLTNYFVGRAKKDFNERNSSIGGIVTATNRRIEGNLDFLHKDAFTGGLDFEHRWAKRAWYVAGNAVLSHVSGSKNSISNTQHSIAHLFQRVDANHLSVDTAATSLTGMGGQVKIGKVGNGKFIFESGFTFRSPELELNDIGFQRQADDIRHFTWAGYRWRRPFSIFNNLAINYNHWVATDFNGRLNQVAWNVNSYATFKNNWWAQIGLNVLPYNVSYSNLRGGPRFRDVPSFNNFFVVETDRRKKIQVGMFLSPEFTKDNARKSFTANAWVTYQPLNAVNISLSPNYNVRKDQLQYVGENNINGEARYLVGNIDQRTLGLSMRINYTINPNLTIQYYGQPFISRGTYTDFKYIVNPLSKVYDEKFVQYDAQQIRMIGEDDHYTVDEDKDGSTDYTIGNPNFAFVQFRSNLVLRWEYLPGSEIYLVWSQGTTGFGNPMDDLTRSLDEQILGKKMENIFLLKATYRLVL